MASIATLPSLFGTLAKFFGVVLKDGLPEDFFQRVIDDPTYRTNFVAAEKQGFVLNPPVPLWRKVDEFTIDVNYDRPSNLPFEGATVEWRTPGLTGWHTVQRRGEDVFVDDRMVELFLAKGQTKTTSVLGHDLRKELEGRVVLHPNVLDALMENIHLIPDSWKKNSGGNKLYNFFWAVGFRN